MFFIVIDRKTLCNLLNTYVLYVRVNRFYWVGEISERRMDVGAVLGSHFEGFWCQVHPPTNERLRGLTALLTVV